MIELALKPVADKFHQLGKHNQKSHGHGGSAVPDVGDTVKSKDGKISSATTVEYMSYKNKQTGEKEDWLKLDTTGKKKWFQDSELEVVSKGSLAESTHTAKPVDKPAASNVVAVVEKSPPPPVPSPGPKVSTPGEAAANIREFPSKHPADAYAATHKAAWDKFAQTTLLPQITSSDLKSLHKDPSFESKQADHLKTLSNAERRAIRGYTSNEYLGINEGLRANGQIKKPTEAVTARNLDTALSKGSGLPHDTTLYRAASLDPSTINVGQVIRDRGFASTSTGVKSEFEGWGSTFIKIRAPKGTPGAYVESLTSTKGQNEWLLPRGAILKFTKVDTSDTTSRGVTVVHADLIGFNNGGVRP